MVGGDLMKWYIERLRELRDVEPIISVCGDDCAVCPRFLAQTDEELHETAVFWHKVGWRDRVVGNDEIKCTGCGCRPECSFKLLPCTREHGVKMCRECYEFECDKIRNVLVSSDEKKKICEKFCDSDEEFQAFVRAFYEKEKNLRK